MTNRPVSLTALLRIDPRDRCGLEWLRKRAGLWLMVLKRRRRYLGGDPCSEEIQLIMALLALKAAAGELLHAGLTRRPAPDHKAGPGAAGRMARGVHRAGRDHRV